MKFVAMLVLFGSLQVQGQQPDKTVTLHVKDVEFEIVLKNIEEQTGFRFNYNSDVLDIVGKVTVNVEHEKVNRVLDLCLKNLPLVYKQKKNKIGIRTDKGKTIATAVAAKRQEEKIKLPSKRRDSLAGAETPKESILDKVEVIAYGKTNRKIATGDIGTVSGDDLTDNILSGMSGRVPRLLITQVNGLPESYYKVQLDGQSTLGTKAGRLPFTDPLFVIDGVPFAPNNNSLQVTGSGSALGTYGRSAMGFIDPNNIARINVLKDADATAIYGSRGARGAVMITTKEGDTGKLHATVSFQYGIHSPTRLPNMLNTQQYVQMRKEALQNDGSIPVPFADDDLLLYDTTRYLDFKKELLGNRARSNDVSYSLSGSKYNIRYYFSTNYHKETTVFPGNLGCKQADLFLHLNYASPDKKLTVALTANYSNDLLHLISTDLTKSLLLSPNSPPLWGVDNKINWNSWSMVSINPAAFLDQTYNSQTENSLLSLYCSYLFAPKWRLKLSAGHNSLWATETSIVPISSQNTNMGPVTGNAFFGKNVYKSNIVEPQVEYTGNPGPGQLTVLASSSLQQIINENGRTNAMGYTTDQDYSGTNGADSVSTVSLPKNMYNYKALFGRISYNLHYKYIVNLTGRMDWSKRFGLTRAQRNFGAVGAAWIFSSESFFKKVNFLSFGKLRGSYGVTGNDPIGDMQYFDAGRSNTADYLERLSNTTLNSETTTKLNGGIDLGFLHDQLFFTMNWFRNRSSNLVISPDTSVKLVNWPAKIQNTGWDLTLRYQSRSTPKWSWSAAVVLTIPSNKLVSFPGLGQSLYRHILQEGKSLTQQKGYHYLGVDANTGLYSFEDKNNDGHIDTLDLGQGGNLDPKIYGGLQYDVSYKNWHFGFFIEGRIQQGYSYLNSILFDAMPGFPMVNQPVQVLDRWQKPGDKATFQRFTAGRKQEVMDANYTFIQSDARYADASFIRAKNIYLTIDLPKGWLDKLHLKQGSIHFQTNNTFTLTHYQVLDPETQVFTTLPPMKTFLVGLKFSF